MGMLRGVDLTHTHTHSHTHTFSLSLSCCPSFACVISRFYLWSWIYLSSLGGLVFQSFGLVCLSCLGLHLRHYTFSLNHHYHHHHHSSTPLFSSLLSLLLCFFCFWLDIPEAATFTTTACYAGQGVQRRGVLGGKVSVEMEYIGLYIKLMG